MMRTTSAMEHRTSKRSSPRRLLDRLCSLGLFEITDFVKKEFVQPVHETAGIVVARRATVRVFAFWGPLTHKPELKQKCGCNLQVARMMLMALNSRGEWS